MHVEQELPSSLDREVEHDVAQQNAVVSLKGPAIAEVALIEAAHPLNLGDCLPVIAYLRACIFAGSARAVRGSPRRR